MELFTWLSVLVLGPGSVAIFVWFLLTIRGALSKADEPPAVTSSGDRGH